MKESGGDPGPPEPSDQGAVEAPPGRLRGSGGRLEHRFLRYRVLLLYTVGRKTGKERTNTLSYRTMEGGYTVVASNAGEDRHPGWYLNLRAAPRTRIRVGRRVLEVAARDLEGEEYDWEWRAWVAFDSAYETYRRRTERRIPIVALEPV